MMLDMKAITPASTTDNVYVGRSAGHHIDDGYANVAIGKDAGFSNGGGNQSYQSVWIGYQAGYSITDSINSVMIGYQAGKSYSTTTADQSVLLGYQAGYNTTTVLIILC